MPRFLRRLVPIAAILLAILAASFGAAPAQASEGDTPHLIHAYEGWVALAVVVLSLAGAGVLVRRALRR
ncbi:hypothetical protein [Massilia sp. Mn16-1_5]|uniref:hypothetical protein n=1 Tax=Massilia sp. Mn16-1_5 TaxID=2079199 RepID=UPI00109ECF19|nr:hypothetical protein [Massilia sp. Mn16-1_5]THC41642.1 hypothetical protein C2862_18200 [Massilia sp. Mn16-1_5]